MTILAVYWDIGGVLLRTVDHRPRQQLAGRFGMTGLELENLVFGSEIGRKAQRGEITETERWALLVDELGIRPEELPAVRQAFFGGDTLDTDLVDYIRRLRPRYRTGVISNGMDGARVLIEETYGLAGLFDHLTFSAEIGYMKPDARIFQHALDSLEVQSEQAVFIDDFMHNIEGARTVGMQGILFKSPGQTINDLEALLAS